MKLVRATSASRLRKMRIKELNRIAREGEEFLVSDERYQVLSGKNYMAVPFVTLVREVEEPKSQAVSLKTNTKNYNEEPEIFVIKPGEEPVKVNEDLEPVVEPEIKKPAKQRRKKVEDDLKEEAKKKPRKRKKSSEETE